MKARQSEKLRWQHSFKLDERMRHPAILQHGHTADCMIPAGLGFTSISKKQET
jgi:hypothetical protein